MHDEVVEILDGALRSARAWGHDAAGWTLQVGPGGYAAWLYGEDEERQWPLSDEVALCDTALEAARACADAFESLPLAAES
ncbi:MAG: hypothetical protein ABMA64_04265 [Myxococcota bacterium]